MSIILRHDKRGSSLVEVVVAASVLAVVSLAFLGSFSVISRLHERDMNLIKAELLAEEGIEAARLIKAGGWTMLSSVAGSTTYLSLGVSSWSFTATPEVVDDTYYRTISVSQVRRDAADDIVSVGGTIDEGTLLVQSSVSWLWRGATSTVSYQSYIANL
ncbi:MAG TPA: hypothetical protein VIR98_01410 [Candidatus Paceibacterota bacterium]